MSYFKEGTRGIEKGIKISERRKETVLIRRLNWKLTFGTYGIERFEKRAANREKIPKQMRRVRKRERERGRKTQKLRKHNKETNVLSQCS